MSQHHILGRARRGEGISIAPIPIDASMHRGRQMALATGWPFRRIQNKILSSAFIVLDAERRAPFAGRNLKTFPVFK